MDVLDHSCSKLGFGGKMCIDGTAKQEEEKDEHYHCPASGTPEQIQNILKKDFPEIKEVNAQLLQLQIPCIIIAVQKNRKGHVAELHGSVCAFPELQGVKMILYVEHTVNANDLPVALWRFCNNLDPKRDQFLSRKDDHEGYTAILGLDGTRKTKEFDNFMREWPNIIIADAETISSVDAKWDQLGIGKLITSPSLKFRDQVYGAEAAVEN